MDIIHDGKLMVIKFVNLEEKDNFLNKAIRPFMKDKRDFEIKDDGNK
jgi:hypothetical protein